MSAWCQPHWDQLRAEIERLGLSDWIAPSGEVAAEQMASQITTGESTPVNYDPLMASWTMIETRSMERVGLQVMAPDFGCPICFFNDHRTDDGRCKCPREDCEAKEPGSIPPFETWIEGEDGAPAAAKAYMIGQGWVTDGG